jgi:hypothetical protein
MHVLDNGHSCWDADMCLLSASHLLSCGASNFMRTAGGSLVFQDATSLVQVKPCSVNMFVIISYVFVCLPLCFRTGVYLGGY